MIKVAFIVCYNNELYMRECMDYISWLKVPEGVETEVIGIAEAESMAAGYNAAMHDSDAKYKVYLHQDVFILNENFIQDMIRIFESNPEYGMLGVIGSNRIITSGNYWINWNVGITKADDFIEEGIYKNDNPQELCEVVALDGMIMITQYDIEWREDIFDGFDFYDVSQSHEFLKKGYKIGIPHQETPWCNHVCGQSKLDEYDGYRKLFCDEYSEFGYQYKVNAELEERTSRNREVQKILPLIREALEAGEWDKMTALLNASINFFHNSTQLWQLFVIRKAIQAEKEKGIKNDFYKDGMSAVDLEGKCMSYKFLLKRLEYDKPVDAWNELLERIAESDAVDLDAEKIIAKHTVMKAEQELVMWKLKRRLEKISDKKFRVQFDDEIFTVPKEEECEQARSICESLRKLVMELADTEGTLDNRKREMVEILFNSIQAISCGLYMRHNEGRLYELYLDVVEEKKNISLFAGYCQKWLDDVLQYVNREERQPLVSVLLSVYNGEEFIEDTLKSVMNQNYENLQIIVVDDCSSDNSRTVIDRLAQSDKRIETLYLTENSNVCKATNLAYKLARGKYIALIGHDDIWKTDKIEKQVHFMEMYPRYAASFTLVDIIDDEKEICNDKAPNLYHVLDQRNCSQKEWIEKILFEQNIFCAPSALIRRQCIAGEYIYHFGVVQLQDMALWIELLTDYPMYILQERLTLYRKFLKCGTNLSAFNDTTRNRLRHENTYIVVNYIKNLSDEKLKLYLSDHFRDKSAEGAAELKCERAFIMQDLGDFHCIEMFFELFDKEETRSVLEEKYHFKLKDFYELNAKTFSYDDEAYYQLLNAHETIRQYEVITERQNEAIEKQKSLLEKQKNLLEKTN